MASIFGKLFCVSTWGESHGAALGVTIDGSPAGLFLNENDIQPMLDRRRPNNSETSTKRKESDKVEILSGVFEGVTTGTPISMIVYNRDQKSRDYSEIANVYRPGHADYAYAQKYGIRDYRGGGRSSGRETVSRVAAGAVAKKILRELDVDVEAKILSMEKPLETGDSAGGVIECVIKNLKPGVGEPVFDKLDAVLSQAIFSIGAVKGVEIGSGFGAAKMSGSRHNDEFYFDEETQKIKKYSNNAGGILGGISDGSDVVIRAAVKPTPSIYLPQRSVSAQNQNVEINIKGRHDVSIVPRAVVVVEAMAAIAAVELIFCGLSARISNIKKIYGGNS
jgi:chorismate synthase